MASADDWFGDQVGPMASIAEYSSAPPRGMTWGPQNPKVRAALAKELNELGVQLEHPSWPPALPDRFKPQSELSMTASTLSRSRSSPSASGKPHPRQLNDKQLQYLRRVTDGPKIWLKTDDGNSRPASQGYSRKDDNKNQSTGMPTSIWRPIKVSNESTERLPPAYVVKHQGVKSSANSEDERGATKRTTTKEGKTKGATGKGTTTKDPPGQGMQGMPSAPPRVLNDIELRNARDALKGQSSLHIAAVADRFHFSADMSAGAPLCIRGAGTAKAIESASWSSDAAYLINRHCGAMRTVNPSGLEAVKVVPKKKKKKKAMLDDDDLQMGESGLFEPKYPLDDSLKSLRKLKRTMFPEEWKREQAEAARLRALVENAEANKVQDTANFFKDALTKKPEEPKAEAAETKPS